MITPEGNAYASEWSRHGREYLDSYLIQEVEHPAINPQSVLIRAFLIDRLFPGKFTDLVDEELYYAACACFALLGQREGWFPELFATAIDENQDEELPAFLQRAYHEQHTRRFTIKGLFEEIAKCLTLGFSFFESPFEDAWREVLKEAAKASPSPASIKCLELACGSANDYRFLDRFGHAAFLEYTGIDVCPENIENAKARFPEIAFDVDDVTRLDEDEREHDLILAFDLYEHLSPEGLEAALDESVRVAREELWLSFFNLKDIPTHLIEPRGQYYWNQLSLSEVIDSLNRSGCEELEVLSIAKELEQRFPGYRHYNQEAHIIMATV